MAQNSRGDAGGGSADGAIRVSQILVGALAMGVLMFSGVVVFLLLSGGVPAGGGSAGSGGTGTGGLDAATARMLVGVMAGLTVVTTIAVFALPMVVVRGLRRRTEGGETIGEAGLVQKYQALTIARAGLAEGPALFATIIVMLTGNWLVFIGTAVGVVVLLVVLPTRGKFDDFRSAATGRGGYGG